ncbi:hypothetical protein ZIOFF_029221 [Zingiber officinale]|uniref:Uncharacterized protein n=1 Tax=Zingiber officinale TaxID=94328 RepID=A0A8J5LAF7_ZINOF|nr:hypothetical protein ZIOFF_029221 [Zingiber officinale]
MASLPKRRKLDGEKSFASLFSLRLLQLQNCKVKDIYHVNRNVPSVTVNYSTSASSISSSEPATALQLEVKIQIQQAKKFAVSQAQQEGCLGNYRSFDSPFGNYIVPVIPTRADLFG